MAVVRSASLEAAQNTTSCPRPRSGAAKLSLPSKTIRTFFTPWLQNGGDICIHPVLCNLHARWLIVLLNYNMLKIISKYDMDRKERPEKNSFCHWRPGGPAGWAGGLTGGMDKIERFFSESGPPCR